MRRTALIALLLTLLAGCAGSPDQLDAAAVDSAVRAALNLLESGINREDALLASQPIGERFFMGGNVAIRYSDAGWGEARGRAPFRSFLTGGFGTYANIDQTLDLVSVEVSGEVASAVVASSFSALRTDRTPAEPVTFTGSDYMLFEYEGGGWKLSRWDEAPAAAP